MAGSQRDFKSNNANAQIPQPAARASVVVGAEAAAQMKSQEDEVHNIKAQRKNDDKNTGSYVIPSAGSQASQWIIEGNIYQSSVNYSNSIKTAAIQEIGLFRDKDGLIRIMTFMNKASFPRLVELITKSKSFVAEFLLDSHTLCANDINHVSDFLNLLAEIDPNIIAIRESIIEVLKPLLKKSKNRSFDHWQRVDDFTYNRDPKGIPKKCQYTRFNSDNKFFQVALKQYSNGKTYVQLNIRDQDKEAVISKLKADGFKLSGGGSSGRKLIKSRDRLINFLNALMQIDAGVKEIADDLIHLYDPSYVEKQKAAFLMGLHDHLGSESSLKYLKNKTLFDQKNILKSIFDFFPPSPTQTSDKESTSNLKTQQLKLMAKKNKKWRTWRK